MFPPPYGLVVQLVRTLACHARGQGFEPPSGRHFFFMKKFASVAQLVEQETENLRVVGSIPTGGTICGFSSSGRAPPCQGGGSEFEPRNPLQHKGRLRTIKRPIFIRHHSQAVRQRSAKPLFPGSIPGGASKNPVHVSGRDFYLLPFHSSLFTIH